MSGIASPKMIDYRGKAIKAVNGTAKNNKGQAMITAMVARKITVYNGRSTVGVFTFDGENLNGPGGRTIGFSTDEKRQAIANAVAAYQPDIYVEKMGYEMTDEDRNNYVWEFVTVVNDAHGKYMRRIPGTGSIKVVLKA